MQGSFLGQGSENDAFGVVFIPFEKQESSENEISFTRFILLMKTGSPFRSAEWSV